MRATLAHSDCKCGREARSLLDSHNNQRRKVKPTETGPLLISETDCMLFVCFVGRDCLPDFLQMKVSGMRAGDMQLSDERVEFIASQTMDELKDAMTMRMDLSDSDAAENKSKASLSQIISPIASESW